MCRRVVFDHVCGGALHASGVRITRVGYRALLHMASWSHTRIWLAQRCSYRPPRRNLMKVMMVPATASEYLCASSIRRHRPRAVEAGTYQVVEYTTCLNGVT